MKFTLPELPYAYNALEPHMDEETVRIHHDKHHQTYTDNFNAALEGIEGDMTVEEILADFSKFPEAKRTAIKNNGGGYYNHALWWTFLSPNGGGEPTGELKEAIEKEFGSVGKLKELMTDAAKTQFGSGWAWLTIKDGKLEVSKTANQDCPLTEGKEVILCIDVWEHAYYLKYQNKRPDFVAGFWNMVNWEEAAKRYAKYK